LNRFELNWVELAQRATDAEHTKKQLHFQERPLGEK